MLGVSLGPPKWRTGAWAATWAAGAWSLPLVAPISRADLTRLLGLLDQLLAELRRL